MATGKVLVIGAGVAGLSAALSLAKRGYGVYLVEREDYLGGRAASYGCKADQECLGCGLCASEDLIEEATAKGKGQLSIMTGAEVASVEGEFGNFVVNVVQKPKRIDFQKCNACGLCARSCPQGAIHQVPEIGRPQAYYIDESKCKGINGSCDVCVKMCPNSAVDLQATTRSFSLSVDGIIAATGFEPFDARILPELGYGRLQGVFTGPDVESILRDPSPGALSSIRGPRVAFIQCVGSRNVQLGRNYCSEVCCKYALRMASALRSLISEIESISLFYMDLQTAGKYFPEIYRKIIDNVRLVQGIPVEIQSDGDHSLVVKYEDVWNASLKSENFNTVILSTGIWPRKDAYSLAMTLGINTDQYGFFDRPDPFNPFVTNRRGILTAGACQKPFGLVESIASGEGAAREMVSLLEAQRK